MERSIVCGVDDSAEARRALLVAAALARSLDLELRAVHVVDTRTTASTSRESNIELPAPADLIQRIWDEGGVHGVLSFVEGGRPADRLRDLAGEGDAKLIVVGSRGRGQLVSTVLGSVAVELGAGRPARWWLYRPRPRFPISSTKGGRRRR